MRMLHEEEEEVLLRRRRRGGGFIDCLCVLRVF
jgi:hypothetical protein